ncbi:MAG: hypothetical protein KAR38_00835, partial [Calditrichia bacterium]|nr:hypothetical protein [Calditrichia bacterium]
MIDFILFVIIFFIIIKLSKYLKLTKKLSERISLLENRLSRFEQPEIAEEKMVEKPESPVVTPGVDTKQPVITAPVKTAPPQK